MKKTISVIAALSVFISVLSFATVTVTANGTAEQPSNKEYELLTKIDFDSEKQPDYYSYSAGNFDGPERVNDSEHGICFKYDRLKPLHWNYNHAIALSNAEGTAPLSIGVLDTVRFSVDINAVKINDNASDIHIGIAYVTKDKEKQIAGEGNGWEGIENKADIISVKHSEIEGKGWKTLSGTFIVPAHRSDEIPYILLYQENDAGTEENEVWLDNIIIEQPKAEKKRCYRF